mmetsp:Transcript_8091/g.20038  ORF Transcript_8091/g.20038 Transcript_8091/m.20038 type:complete len:483 (+) Transcript_8091:151-1599(+)|eukprot:CAMPEP_0172388026 /NCGR_PEP_ID=MMETSP1061-20121228/5200_1 /TAXON_ID=37318 /ORGANISM="Pseudo-nitzschia pungens, Strain cf. pungens" /LENGTH=482 /DNA_ID=CAMNT_0013117815 /DNA_START=123 /DNA_END=1571 /DNA_ORIENTATION=+
MKKVLAVAVLLVWGTVTSTSFAFRGGLLGSSGRKARINRRLSLSLSSARNEVLGHERILEDESSCPLRVGIAGAGAVAFGMASILAKNGHQTLLWSPSGKGTADLIPKDQIESKVPPSITSTGAMHHEFVPEIASSAQQLATESDVLIVALPANGHKQIFDALAPHLSASSPSSSSATAKKKHIIVSSHASFGALYLSQFLHELGNHHHTITSWGTTVCTARRKSGSTVDIKTIRKSVDTSCVPESDSDSSLELCSRLFPDIQFRPREGLLAITLSNLNPQNHLAIAMGNISRMDKGEEWYQFQNITPRIGGFLEQLDRERLEIASALGLDVKTVYEHFNLSFHVPIPQSGSLSEMCQDIYKKGNDVHGPTVADSRYITEDVPFGLAPVVALGKLVGRPAILHESGMAICNAMYGRDFSAENDLLEAIDLDGIELSELREAARTGQLSKPIFFGGAVTPPQRHGDSSPSKVSASAETAAQVG